MRSDESYWELLRDLWADGKSFIIVEHDIVVNETTIDELKICDHDWCAMPFHYRGNDHAYALACTKISADLIRRHPEVPEIIAGMSDAKHPPMHWCRLDAWLFAVLTELGEKRHNHFWAKSLQHVGPQVPKHGCVTE